MKKTGDEGHTYYFEVCTGIIYGTGEKNSKDTYCIAYMRIHYAAYIMCCNIVGLVERRTPPGDNATNTRGGAAWLPCPCRRRAPQRVGVRVRIRVRVRVRSGVVSVWADVQG